MVRKLIKHEALRTRGQFLVIFGAATLLALVGAGFALTGWPFISVLGLILGMFGTAALIPVTQLALAVDYWTSSYRRIGYFTQTLPVKGSTIYWSKLAWALVVVIASLVWAAALGLLTVVGSSESLGMTVGELFSTIGAWLSGLASALPWWGWIVGVVLVLLFLATNILMFFFSASVGSERRLNQFGAGGPVLVWFLSYVAMQIVVLALMMVPLGIGWIDGSVVLVQENFLALLLTNTEPDVVPAGIIVGFVLMAIVFMWRTHVSWNRKVSLA